MKKGPFYFIGTNRFFFTFSIISLVLILLRALFIPIMEIDAAQYASISREMLERGEFLKITDQLQDYLDKPPLLFWLSALSLRLFGISSFSYKFPSFLIALWGVYGVFALCRHLYDTSTAKTASLIYMGSLSFILMTNDVRTDTMLTAFIILSVWQLYKYFEFKKWQSLLLASLFIAMAMLTKGPIGCVAPLMAVIPHYILKGRFEVLRDPKLVLIPIIVLSLLSPMLYGLYVQFDLHPNKEIYGLKGPSGIRFYFWDQSFGRITGTSQWVNDKGPFFFVHTLLWAFLPYSLSLIFAMIQQVKNIRLLKEYISLTGFILPWIGLSFSSYKLPHYIYIIIPFASILTARYSPRAKYLQYVHTGFLKILGVISIALSVFLMYCFKFSVIYVLLLVVCTLLLIVALKNDNNDQPLSLGVLSSIIIACTLNFHFYPNLLRYQAGSELAFYIKSQNIPTSNLCFYMINNRITGFYLNQYIPPCSENIKDDHIIITDADGFSMLKNQLRIRTIKEFADLNVTRLKFKFLLPKYRQKFVKKILLVEVGSHE